MKKEGQRWGEGGVGPEPLSTSGPSAAEHSQKLPNRAGAPQGTTVPVDNQRCPRPRRQHTNAHPRGWPLMGGQGGTQRRHSPSQYLLLEPQPCKAGAGCHAGAPLRSRGEVGQDGEKAQRGEKDPPSGQARWPSGKAAGSGTSRKAGRVPSSFPQEPTSPLLPGDLVLRCGIHVSHTAPNAHSPTRPPYSFLPFSERSLSAPPTAILQMSLTLNTLDPTQTQALHVNPIRSLTWILEQGREQGTPPWPLPQPLPTSPASLWPDQETTLPPTQPATPAPPVPVILQEVVVFIGKRHSDPSAAPSPLWCSPGRGPHWLDVRP